MDKDPAAIRDDDLVMDLPAKYNRLLAACRETQARAAAISAWEITEPLDAIIGEHPDL